MQQESDTRKRYRQYRL
ncbi:hypothetical protein CP8484711_0635A, partial [Chlamydia psittaci 84-8471/1]